MTKSKATISVNGGEAVDLDELSSAIGHNRPRAGGVAADQLRSIIQRVEKLDEEKAGIAADIRDVFAEAKGNGFDTRAIRTILKMRKMEPAEREEQETVLDTYLHALGMVQGDLFEPEASTPTSTESDDKLYAVAVEIVQRDRNASTSYLQRVMTIGYNRAASLMERLEAEGIVSEANHIGKREVLISQAVELEE